MKLLLLYPVISSTAMSADEKEKVEEEEQSICEM